MIISKSIVGAAIISTKAVTVVVAAEASIIVAVTKAIVGIVAITKAIVGIVVTKAIVGIVVTKATNIRNVIVVGSAGMKKFTVRTGTVRVIAAYFSFVSLLVF